MGVDKQGSKGGAGYVGGFFQLFDWNLKSRKKLFSNKSDLPERLKQGKRTDANLPSTQLHLMNEDEIGAGLSIKGSSDYSCSSSVTDDEGTRAPGVVARLMGLDSLPTSSSTEPYSTPFFDCPSPGDSHYSKKNIGIHNDHQIMHSSNLPSKVDGPARNAMESKLQKMSNRPIEKFQTEILPPKLAKSIPVTHHKLLSPIKGCGFVPTKNAAHIMEAAAKIIEHGPQTTSKAKVSPVGPSVPLRIRDLKEKMEAPSRPPRVAETSRRPNESNAAKYLKGQYLNKSWNGSVDTSFRVCSDAEENCTGPKNKGKSISLAVQAKANVQRREGLNTSGNRSFVGQREQGDLRPSQSSNSQLNVQKSVKKKSTRNSPGVLRQNNQKQNCLDRDKLSPRPLASNMQGRKPVSGESSVGRPKITSKSTGNVKSGSRKLGLEVADSEKRIPYSKTNNLPRKKRSIDGDFHLQRNRLHDDPSINKSEKPIQLNPETDRHFNWAEESRKKGMDVVSFSFTAPMTRSTSGSESSNQVAEKNNGIFRDRQGKRMLDDSDSSKLSTLGINVIGGDALSALLEQKLKELTYGIEHPRCNSSTVGAIANPMSNFPDLVPDPNKFSTIPILVDRRDHHELHTDKLVGHFDSNLSLTERSDWKMRHKFQGVEAMDEYIGGAAKARHPSPISVLEPFPTESCNSSDSIESSTTEGSRHCSSVQAQEMIGLGSSKKFRSVETDTELSDSASSTSTGTLARKAAVVITREDYPRSNKWELDYVKDILCNLELMFKDFVLGRARKIINPHLFDQLESRTGGLEGNGDASRINRKVLFDCVSENLDLRCRRYVSGGHKMWAKGMAMVRRNQRLAEEVHDEIYGWRGMGDFMVDELVDKDMSSQYGRWLDFEVEGFAVGSDIESQIFNSLVDEVVADVLL